MKYKNILLIKIQVLNGWERFRTIGKQKRDNFPLRKLRKIGFTTTVMVFINYYKSEGKLNLKLLSLGQKYEVEKAIIIQDRLSNGVLFKSRNNFNFEAAFPSGSQEFKDLRELFYMSEAFSSEVVYEEAYNDFEDICNNNNITVKIIDEEISKLTKKIINRYE